MTYHTLGSELWKPQLAVGSPGMTPGLSAIEADVSLSSGNGDVVMVGEGGSKGSQPILASSTFFRIAEHPMKHLTLLGETSMKFVDFFAQTYSIVLSDGGNRMVCPNDTLLLAP